MDIEQLYVELKPLLFSLAYQILGSVTDAEDIVQDTFMSLHENEPTDTQFIKAYMCKVVTNKCLNKLKSSSKQREMYVGPWLPEPLVTRRNNTNDPLEQFISKESTSTAYLLLLQQLSAVERVVFLLRELFSYRFEEIASIIDKSSGNSRQIFYRAKKRIGSASKKNTVPRNISTTLTEQFVSAIATGNINSLLTILSTESVLYTDGGGKTNAALRPIVGQELIIRYFTTVRDKVPAHFECFVHEINGNPGIIIKIGELTFSVISFQIKENTISDIYIVMNPEKLYHLNK
ncbi:RNA polymerase sigma-70 factor [Paenibacillus sp. GSMTC-2017]|uniref:RNA polymerase sigma-70 factor n=1 Tax=Paenibacillus sp. GSMTC-2017 TaxID=2794350 RepID=UPI0018D771B2|nr:RNA polymerase sigma-70 factor [Paenibacillus sp. GSMTC-2017]